MGIEALLSTQIIDTTTVGRAVMTAADAAAARTAIGAGTSSFSGAYSALSGIPSTFAPSAHKTSHATGGSDALTAADIGAAATSHTHAAADITSGTIATARLASGTANSTTYLRGDQTWQTIAAGVGGSTGAVDNAILRADGTGGSTAQASNWLIADNYTASPNNTVNHASIQATGTTTNVSVSIVPKGTGAFCLAVPDGTATGGNARGANAIDLQTTRTAASQVASAADSICIGKNNTSTAVAGIAGISIGFTCTASSGIAIGSNCSSTYAGFAAGENAAVTAQDGTAIGRSASASQACCAIGTFVVAQGVGSFSQGANNSATASYASATGRRAVADRLYMSAKANDMFAAAGDRQEVSFIAANKTTDGTTAVTLFLDGTSTRLTIPSGKILFATAQIVGSKSDGTAVATYMRKFAIKNVGGTTTLVGSVETIGTDVAAGTSLSITADDTNDALQIAVTGVASETWRWVAVVYGVELAYGT